MTRALRSPRVWLLTLLALALLLGSLAPFASPSAQASHDHEVWRSILIFANIGPSGSAGVGCTDEGTAASAYACSNSSVLTNNTFEFRGVDYTFKTIRFDDTDNTIYLTFDKNVPDDFDAFTFHNGFVDQYSLADFTKNGATISLRTHNVAGASAIGFSQNLWMDFEEAHPGDLDPSFGIGGKLTTAFKSPSSQIHDIVRLPGLAGGNKIVAVGFAHNGTNRDFALARYNADGSLDETFGNSGRVLTNISGDDEARAVVLQSDGKIVVAGFATVGGGKDFAVARYTADGLLDTTFSTDGKHTINMGANDTAHAVGVDSNDKVVLGGQAGDNFGVARLTAAGALDTTFSTDGKATVDFHGLEDGAHALAIVTGNKIVLGGFATNNNGTTTGATATDDDHRDFALARLTAAGALDTGFSTDGKVMTDVGTLGGASGSTAGTGDTANGMDIQADGKIVLAGDVQLSNQFAVGLARYTAAGAPDTGFGATDSSNTRTGRVVTANNQGDSLRARCSGYSRVCRGGGIDRP
jgi:uncharacterized delta-60 repeat protein